MNVFCVPVQDHALIYAPLNRVFALVDGEALAQIRAHQGKDCDPSLFPLLDALRKPALPPAPPSGAVRQPAFLGIIPSRGCNMGCHYCDFAAPKQDSPIMPLELAEQAVDSYFRLLRESSISRAQIHFFGGEPFFAEKVVRHVVNYAREMARLSCLDLYIEATSNGLYRPATCEWIAHHFDAIVLSLDGPADILDRHRPGVNGQSVAEVLIRSAKRLSQGPVELFLRACVTADTVHRLPEIARWMVAEFRPKGVCFEMLSLAHTDSLPGFAVPEAWDFAVQFIAAEQILAEAGIETVLSTAETHLLRTSFCPVGQDALIVSPDGAVDACYLLEKDWQQAGLNMRLGRVDEGGFKLSDEAVQEVRKLSVENKSLCQNCLCRYHCAGGCHINHRTDTPPDSYDNLCIQTRIITIYRLLRQMGEPWLADAWISDKTAVERSVYQQNDRLWGCTS